MTARSPIVSTSGKHDVLSSGDTLAYAPVPVPYGGQVQSFVPTQADFGAEKVLAQIVVPRRPVAYAHMFVGHVIVRAEETVPSPFDRHIALNINGLIGKLNDFNIAGEILSINGDGTRNADVVSLPVALAFPETTGDATVNVTYYIYSYNTIAADAKFWFQLVGSYLT